MTRQVSAAQDPLELVGGELCLDFANTGRDRTAASPTDRLADYAALVEWGRRAGALEPDEARRLRREANRRPEEAVRTHRRGIALREALYRIFAATARGEAPSGGDLDRLTEEWRAALERLVLVPGSPACRTECRGEEGDLDRALWPIARSAADLVTSERLQRVRQCDGEGCHCLFLDTSRNRSRRWCDMRECGNRAKARRHYRRRRQDLPSV